MSPLRLKAGNKFKMPVANAADGLVTQCRQLELDLPHCEYRFHETRRWRFDLAWPAKRIACEVDGGGFVGGRHTRGMGLERDCEKANEAAIEGWRVLRVTPRQINTGAAIDWISRMLAMFEDVEI